MMTPLDRRQAAEYLTKCGLKTSANTLEKLACLGGGPRYRRIGNRALYTLQDLDAHVEAKTSAPLGSTSEAA
jgi:hypothetical protein